ATALAGPTAAVRLPSARSAQPACFSPVSTSTIQRGRITIAEEAAARLADVPPSAAANTATSPVRRSAATSSRRILAGRLGMDISFGMRKEVLRNAGGGVAAASQRSAARVRRAQRYALPRGRT